MPNARSDMVRTCRGRSSRSSALRRSYAFCPGATGGSASSSWRGSSTCRRAPCTGSCGRSSVVGFVEQDAATAKYQLGAALLHMGSSYLDGNELRTRALNWSDSLAARSGESVRIGTLHEGQVLVVHHVFRPDDSRQALEVGALLPAHATALGKVLLAANRYAAAELTAVGLPGFTPSTITDGDAFAAQLDAVLEQGWAADAQELVVGEASLAAPIHDRRGVVVGAIGISGPIERLLEQGNARTDLVSYVREAARAVSRDLGGIPW